MNGTRHGGGGGSDELGRDPELARALEWLDPASRDAHYWLRFRSRVVEDAAPQLARRRMMADLTVGEVMSAWARMVVPTAMIAAAAALAMVRTVEPEVPARVTVEDLLVVDLEDASIPAALAEDVDLRQVALAGESF